MLHFDSDEAGGDGGARLQTAWLTKAAKRAHLADHELCLANRQVMSRKADVLGGGVYKKWLGGNLYRSILVARGRQYWVYSYLFAKQNKAKIEDEDLAQFRLQAAVYARKTDKDIARDASSGELTEICREEKI